MKNLGKLAVLGAALAVSSSLAFADQIGSYGTGSLSQGNTNSAMSYGGFIFNGGSLASFATDPSADITNNAAITSSHNSVQIGAGSPWANALANTSWISYIAGTNPSSPGNPTVVAPQGYYTFTTTLSEAAGIYGVSLNVLADDSTAVYFNNGSGYVLEYAAGPLGNDGACATGSNAINCETPTPVNFSATFTGGSNDTLTFVVEQTGFQDFGLDFNGTVSTTPEPSSLMLLGTGLTGAAGMFFRRRRNA